MQPRGPHLRSGVSCRIHGIPEETEVIRGPTRLARDEVGIPSAEAGLLEGEQQAGFVVVFPRSSEICGWKSALHHGSSPAPSQARVLARARMPGPSRRSPFSHLRDRVPRETSTHGNIANTTRRKRKLDLCLPPKDAR